MLPYDERRSAGETIRMLVSGAETSGRIALIEILARRSAASPRHLHHWEDEFVYVLEGEVAFHLDGQRLLRPAGTGLFLPVGREHAYAVVSEEARLLVVMAPAGLEGCLVDLTGTAGDGSPAVERLVTLAARYGIEITGPPPAEDP
jgi:quercetin dioxygenase-like cupin family protein